MKVCGKTDVGLRRHENQDTFAVEHGEKLLIAVVCDGMGGAEGGQIASSLAVETFMKEIRALLRADRPIRRSISARCKTPPIRAWAPRLSVRSQGSATP